MELRRQIVAVSTLILAKVLVNLGQKNLLIPRRENREDGWSKIKFLSSFKEDAQFLKRLLVLLILAR